MQDKFFQAILKITAPLLMASVLGSCIGFRTVSGSPRYAPGAYEGTGQGFRGPVHVLVRLDAGGITGIEIFEHGDDEQLGGAAMEELLALVLDSGGPDVDGISGATESSAGFLSAVEDALSRAGSL
jgi:fumarate reductase flavoprotein subunit